MTWVRTLWVPSSDENADCWTWITSGVVVARREICLFKLFVRYWWWWVEIGRYSARRTDVCICQRTTDAECVWSLSASAFCSPANAPADPRPQWLPFQPLYGCVAVRCRTAWHKMPERGTDWRRGHAQEQNRLVNSLVYSHEEEWRQCKLEFEPTPY